MSDLLNRVRIAREKATAQFIKDMVIHEMAMSMKPFFPEIVDMATQRAKNDKHTSVAYHLTDITQKLFKPHLREATKKPPSEFVMKFLGGQDIIDLATKMQASDQSARYNRMIDHIKGFEDMVNAHSLSEINALPAKEKERLYATALQFHDIYSKSLDRVQIMYRREQRGFNPETLVLQGGGAKGISYAGVAEVFHKHGMMGNIKHVAGTSAGALMGLLVAMGLPTEDINNVVKNGQFAQFFSESTGTFKLAAAPGLLWDRFRNKVDPSERPYLEGFNLSEFAKEFMLPQLTMKSGVSIDEMLKMSDKEMGEFLARPGLDLDAAYAQAQADYESKLKRADRHSEIGLLKFSSMLDNSMAWQACAHSIRSQRSSKHPENDLIESYLGDLIEMTVRRYLKQHPDSPLAATLDTADKMRSLDFTTLKALAEESKHQSFKEFGVAITRSHMFSLSWFPRAYNKTVDLIKQIATGEKPLDKGFGPQDVNVNFQPVFVRAGGGEYIDMPIKKAVRTSMNLPVLFDPIKHEGGKYIDGGMNSNYPYRMFLDKHGNDVQLAEELTAGFMLSTLDSDMENFAVDEMAKVAKKSMAIELEKYPENFTERLKNGSREFGIFMYSLGVNILKLEGGQALSQIKSALLDPIKKMSGKGIDFVMDRNNVSLPSEQILENTGVINTGRVDTADFHLNAEQKEQLMAIGKRSALSLLSGHADRHLRFSKDRLVSLINIENELRQKEGSPEILKLPMLAMNDSYQLMQALKGSMQTEISLNDTLGGRLPDMISKIETIEGVKGSILDDEKNYKDDLKFG